MTGPPIVRVQASPLASATAAAAGAVGWPTSWPARWSAHVRAAMAGADRAALRAALAPTRPLAIELLGHGDEPHPTIERQLAALHASRRVGGAVAEALARIWERALAPLWPALEALLERELLRLAEVLASEGTDAVLGAVRPPVALAEGRLRWAGAASAPVALDGRRLCVAPVLCAPDRPLVATGDRDVVIAPALADAAHLWEPRRAAASHPLVSLLGATRARVLLAVTAPGTTLDIAEQLGISPALASHHLVELSRNGLVDGARFGRRVFYRLTDRGRRLRDACEAG